MPLQKLVDGVVVDLTESEDREFRRRAEADGTLGPTATNSEIIRAAAFNHHLTDGDAWKTLDATALSAAIQEPKILRPMRLGDFWRSLFGLVIGTSDEATVKLDAMKARREPAVLQSFSDALERGNKRDAEANLDLYPIDLDQPSPGLKPATITAGKAVLDANAMSVVDLLCDLNGLPSPVDLSPTAVGSALTSAGYSWDGVHWVST